MEGTMQKVLLIGLDGATFDMIHPLSQAGRLPNLTKLMAEGCWGTLKSSIPPITPTAWTTVFTGKNPGKHGVFDFQELDRQTYRQRPVPIDKHREKTIWDLLGEVNIPSIVVDVPFTYPPRPLNGVMITGYGTPRTPGTPFTYPTTFRDKLPADLQSELRVALPKHDFDRSRAFLDEWDEIINGRFHLLHHLITQQEWGFFFFVFSITDNLAHVFWTYVDPNHPNYHRPEAVEYREAFYKAYERCDELLGKMILWAGPNSTTLVMSDHGFGSVYPRQYLFRRLAEGNFLTYQHPKGVPLSGQLLKLAMRVYTGMPFLREWIKNLRPGSQSALKSTLRRTGMLPHSDAIDFAKSRVLPSNFGLQLWLNRVDRFAKGVVKEEETAVLLQTLTDYLQADINPITGKPIIRHVYKGTDIYDGPEAELAPDLVIENNNFFQPNQTFTKPNAQIEGGHTHDGIFLALGTAVQSGQLHGPRLVDLAPTVLHLLGQPIPPDMDGEVMIDLLTSTFRENNPIQIGSEPAQHPEPLSSQTHLSAEEEAEINEQFRQLGYL
jgi:predicted AlkP superfamily phosphohydrolase/phosphomutase